MPERGRVLTPEQVEAMMDREQAVGPRFGTSAEQVALARSHELLREALQFYADNKNWTQPTPWGGRIWDDDGLATRDGGQTARAVLAAGKEEQG